ncbi:FHA domain-containing protein, partial [Meloidogyne graminicola]
FSYFYLNTVTTEKVKYKLPEWIGCPPKGTHLDVMKASKLIQNDNSFFKMRGQSICIDLDQKN